MLNNNQCADFLLPHIQTSHYHRHDIVMLQRLFFRTVKKTGQCADMSVRPQSQEETAYLILKKNNQRDHTHIHQCVENRAQQFHFQHLRHHQPDQDKNQNSGEHLDRTGSFHQFVGIVQNKSYQQNIDKIFYAKLKKHAPSSYLSYPLSIFNFSVIRTASTASRTSCTRRICAPFINATVSNTVVPFNESCGVPPNNL